MSVGYFGAATGRIPLPLQLADQSPIRNMGELPFPHALALEITEERFCCRVDFGRNIHERNILRTRRGWTIPTRLQLYFGFWLRISLGVVHRFSWLWVGMPSLMR